MKKKWIWIGLSVLVVALTAAVLGIYSWFYAPGIHVLAGQANVDVEATGYVINGKTGEVIGQTPVTAKGTSSQMKSEDFKGELLVLGYQNTTSDGTIAGAGAVETTDSGFYMIHYFEECVHSEGVNGVGRESHFCDYSFRYYFYPKDPDFLVVYVNDVNDSTPYYVVCADSEAEALEDYRWFMENLPD